MVPGRAVKAVFLIGVYCSWTCDVYFSNRCGLCLGLWSLQEFWSRVGCGRIMRWEELCSGVGLGGIQGSWESSWPAGHSLLEDLWGLLQSSGIPLELWEGPKSVAGTEMEEIRPQVRSVIHRLWLVWSAPQWWRKSTRVRSRTQKQGKGWTGMTWAWRRLRGIQRFGCSFADRLVTNTFWLIWPTWLKYSGMGGRTQKVQGDKL